jgi:hypothetical protein
MNRAFVAVNSLLRDEVPVMRTSAGFFVPRTAATERVLRNETQAYGLMVSASAAVANPTAVRKARIALWDRYGGSMTSGWIRWMLEQFEFDFKLIYPPEIDAGMLSNFDVLILPSDASFGGRGGDGQSSDTTIPEEWRNRMGSLSVETSAPKVKEFLESGGTVIAIGGAGSLARHLGLPISNHVVETVNGEERSVPRDKFYVPTSLLQMDVNTSNSAAWGMPKQADVFFDNSPVYRLLPGAEERGITPILSFSGDSPLRSGWAWGQDRLNGGAGGFEAFVGQGRLLVYGPEITFRAQPHGTFKLLFNALYKTSLR